MTLHARAPGCVCRCKPSCVYSYSRTFPGDGFEVEQGTWEEDRWTVSGPSHYPGWSYTHPFTTSSNASLKVLYDPGYVDQSVNLLTEVRFHGNISSCIGDKFILDFNGVEISFEVVTAPEYWGGTTLLKVTTPLKTTLYPGHYLIYSSLSISVWSNGKLGYLRIGNSGQYDWMWYTRAPIANIYQYCESSIIWGVPPLSLPLRFRTRQNSHGLSFGTPVFYKVSEDCSYKPWGYCTETGTAPDSVTLTTNAFAGCCSPANGSYVLQPPYPNDPCNEAWYTLSPAHTFSAPECCRMQCGWGWVNPIGDPRCPPGTPTGTSLPDPEGTLAVVAWAWLERNYRPYLNEDCEFRAHAHVGLNCISNPYDSSLDGWVMGGVGAGAYARVDRDGDGGVSCSNSNQYCQVSPDLSLDT